MKKPEWTERRLQRLFDRSNHSDFRGRLPAFRIVVRKLPSRCNFYSLATSKKTISVDIEGLFAYYVRFRSLSVSRFDAEVRDGMLMHMAIAADLYGADPLPKNLSPRLRAWLRKRSARAELLERQIVRLMR
jgi:hypothetical protein